MVFALAMLTSRLEQPYSALSSYFGLVGTRCNGNHRRRCHTCYNIRSADQAGSSPSSLGKNTRSCATLAPSSLTPHPVIHTPEPHSSGWRLVRPTFRQHLLYCLPQANLRTRLFATHQSEDPRNKQFTAREVRQASIQSGCAWATAERPRMQAEYNVLHGSSRLRYRSVLYLQATIIVVIVLLVVSSSEQHINMFKTIITPCIIVCSDWVCAAMLEQMLVSSVTSALPESIIHTSPLSLSPSLPLSLYIYIYIHNNMFNHDTSNNCW